MAEELFSERRDRVEDDETMEHVKAVSAWRLRLHESQCRDCDCEFIIDEAHVVTQDWMVSDVDGRAHSMYRFRFPTVGGEFKKRR